MRADAPGNRDSPGGRLQTCGKQGRLDATTSDQTWPSDTEIHNVHSLHRVKMLSSAHVCPLPSNSLRNQAHRSKTGRPCRQAPKALGKPASRPPEPRGGTETRPPLPHTGRPLSSARAAPAVPWTAPFLSWSPPEAHRPLPCTILGRGLLAGAELRCPMTHVGDRAAPGLADAH